MSTNDIRACFLNAHPTPNSLSLPTRTNRLPQLFPSGQPEPKSPLKTDRAKPNSGRYKRSFPGFAVVTPHPALGNDATSDGQRMPSGNKVRIAWSDLGRGPICKRDVLYKDSPPSFVESDLQTCSWLFPSQVLTYYNHGLKG